MGKLPPSPEKFFNVVRKYSDIKTDIEAVFAKYELDEEAKMLVLSIIGEEYLKNVQKKEKV